MTLAIETIGLRRRFGRHWALDGVDLRVPARAVYGFLGPNGAGKTTTFRIILGLLKAHAGEVRLFGARRDSKARIGSIVETPVIYDHLTGRENLDLTRRMLRLPRVEVERVLEVVRLGPARDRRAGGYSLGMRQRLGLARALLGSPRLLLLDEPSNGLDPDAMRDMRVLLRELVRGTGVTILLSSHLLSEVEQVADHVGLMRGGRLIAQGPLGELTAAAGAVLEIEVGEPARATALLAASGATVEESGDRLDVRLAPGWTPAQANRALVEAGIAVSRLAPRRASLETLYATGPRAAPAGAAL